jgi:hypothetical protein
MTINNRAELDWAPKVSLSKIRQLYLQEARGLVEDDLVDEVGTRLYKRCASILEFTEATRSRVQCMRCARSGIKTVILRKTNATSEIVKCSVCGWQVRWRVYLQEAEKSGGNLHVGHAEAAFVCFVQDYPGCRDSRQKILAIDLLIHEFHWILLEDSQEIPESIPHKPAGLNLLQSSTNQILEFLNQLTYGEKTAPELLANREWWLAQKPVRAQRPVSRMKSG